MTPQDERLLDFARRYTRAWCSQDPRRVAACFAPEGSQTVNGGTPATGRAAIAEQARAYMAAFPDLRVVMDDLVVRNDVVEYHWTLLGTSSEDRRVRISGVEEWTLGGDGLIASSQGRYDQEEYERQLAEGI
jgi:uncharacterized protein (TIGR02246 family)